MGDAANVIAALREAHERAGIDDPGRPVRAAHAARLAMLALPALVEVAEALLARTRADMDGCSCDTVFWRTRKGKRVCGGSNQCNATRAALARLAEVKVDASDS